MSNQPELRTTRFVCVSDTHNAVPGGAFKLPAGDVLIHAGDLSNQGSFSELQKTIKWIEDAPFEVKIVVAGNHDITLDADFYAQHGSSFHSQELQDVEKCRALFAQSSSIIWLNHEFRIIKLTSLKGPRTSFSVFGSPFSPSNGKWAFGYEPKQAARLWSQIPSHTDIVISHTPPRNHCDRRRDDTPLGCEVLRQNLWRVRPRLAICGHCHESRGAERIQWNLVGPDQASIVQKWIDPAKNAKQISLIDLTVKGGNPLMNGGFNANNEEPPSLNMPSTSYGAISADGSHSSSTSTAPATDMLTNNTPETPASDGNDLAAVRVMSSRKETCVINAAIMSGSWPHHGGKKYNKPIVVDIDLPVW